VDIARIMMAKNRPWARHAALSEAAIPMMISQIRRMTSRGQRLTADSLHQGDSNPHTFAAGSL